MGKMKQGGFLIAKIHQISGRVFSKILHDSGVEINPAQGRILFVLWQEDGLPIQALSKQTSLGKSTLTSMLDRLEAAGHIRREPSKTDRRQILIWRTEKDRALQTQYEMVSKEMTEIYYRGFHEGQIQRFEKDLQTILENLEAVERKSSNT